MYEIRIKDTNTYPFDFAIENYFTDDDFSDCYDTRDKAIAFIKILNKNGYSAYLFEY